MRVFWVAMLICLLSVRSEAGEAGRFDFYDASLCVSPTGEPVSAAQLDKAAQYVDDRVGPGAFSALRRDPRKQVILCRILGEQTPTRKKHWPAVFEPVVFHIGQGIAPADSAALSEALTNWYLAFTREIGIAVTHPVTVFGGLSRDSIYRELQDHGPVKYDRDDFAAAYDVVCAQADRPGGFSVFNFVILCLPDANIAGHLAGPFLIETFLHEAMHVIQYQLLGQPENGSDAHRLEAFGPEWLLEGSADYLSLPVVYKPSAVSAKIGELARETAPNPAPSEHYSEFQALGLYGYENALLRTHALVAGASRDALVEFYTLIGLGLRWPDAFARVFGVSPQQIYERDFVEFQ